MSYSEEQINEDYITALQTLISKNPEGLTFIQLFDRLSIIPEQTDLSECLHESTQRKICAKIDGKYYPHGYIKVSPTVSEEKTNQEIHELLTKNPETSSIMGVVEQVQEPVQKVITTNKHLTKVEPLEAEKIKPLPNGTLRRNGVAGKLAYALWRCRGDMVSRKDINLILEDATSGAIYQAVSSLCQLETIKRIGNDFPNSNFTWGDKLGYPFPNQLPMDKNLLPFNSYVEFLKWKQYKLDVKTETQIEKVDSKPNFSEVSPPTKNIVLLTSVKSSTETPIEQVQHPQTKISTAREMVKIRILHHENELMFLKQLLVCLPDE